MAELANAVAQLDDDELTFMLAELEGARQLIESRRKRGEQAVLLCVSFWTALAGAVAIIAAATQISQASLDWTVGLALFAASVVAKQPLWRSCPRFRRQVISRSRYLAARQYFLDRFPSTLKYLEGRSGTELLQSWQAGFGRAVQGSLTRRRVCNCLALCTWDPAVVKRREPASVGRYQPYRFSSHCFRSCGNLVHRPGDRHSPRTQ